MNKIRNANLHACLNTKRQQHQQKIYGIYIYLHFFFFACINLKRFYLTNVKYPEYLETQHMKENRIMNILSQRFDPVHVHWWILEVFCPCSWLFCTMIRFFLAYLPLAALISDDFWIWSLILSSVSLISLFSFLYSFTISL